MKRLEMWLPVIVLGLTFPQFGHTQGSLIWSQSFSNSEGRAGTFTQAAFVLDYEHTNPPVGFFEPLFNQISFGTNDVGHTFTIAATADDPDFAAVVNALTNGIDQDMGFLFGPSTGAGFSGGSGPAFMESQLFAGVGTGPDLIGYQIQSFGLHIDSLSIGSRPGGGTDFSGQVTLSISGIPVPEPSPSWLVLLGGGVLLYARRKKCGNQWHDLRHLF